MDGRADLSRLSIARYEPEAIGVAVGCASKLFWLAGVGGVLLIAYAEADRRDLVPWNEKKPADATVVTVKPADLKPPAPRGPRPLMAPVIGYVLAAKKASIGFARAGKIKELHAEIGKVVEAGEVIARLEDQLLRAEVSRVKAALEGAEQEIAKVDATLEGEEHEIAKVEATLEEAERELARREKLLKEGVGSEVDRDQMRSRVKVTQVERDQMRSRVKVTKVERDQMHSRVNVTKAELELAEQQLAQCELVAPFKGTVSAKHTEVGETVGGFMPGAGGIPSGAVVTITDLSAPEIEADVPEAFVEKLEPEQPAEVELDAISGVKLKGKLRLILPIADRRKATVPVRVALAEPPAKIRPDMSARVTFLATHALDEPSFVPADPAITVAPVAKPKKPLDDAVRIASEVASKADRLPWFRHATFGALGAAVSFMVLGRALRARRSARPTSPPPPRPAAASPPPPPPKATAAAPPPPKKEGPKRASFRLQQQDSISDIESVDEMYVLDEEEDTASGAGTSDAAEPPAPSRRVHPLGKDGRIAGDGKPVKGGALDLGGVKVSFAVEGTTGAHVFPANGASVSIEGIGVGRDGAPLVHGMVFTVAERPWIYLDRAANQAERRRIYAVQVEGETSVEEKVFPPEPPPVLEGEAIVSIRGLEKVYRRGDNEVRVLNGLDLDIATGDFLALMGPSGSGKSTLLNVIAGIDRPTGGTVHVAGVEIGSLSESSLAEWRARNVGFIFQFYNLIPVLSAVENVEIALNLTDLPAAEKRRRALHALDLVGLADRAEHKPRELSGGQEQRVAIARAIATDPRLLVADEPTGDLDAENALAILELLVRLNRELGKTIVMVTHDPRAAARAKHIRHLEKGVLA